jgi:hypothetical protein
LGALLATARAGKVDVGPGYPANDGSRRDTPGPGRPVVLTRRKPAPTPLRPPCCRARGMAARTGNLAES